MTSLYNINPDSADDGQQQSLEDFQFDLDTVLKNVKARLEVSRGAQRGLGDAGHSCRNKEQDCSRGFGRDRHRRAKNQWTKVLYAVLAANTARRAKMIVRGDATKNGAWAWTTLRERFGRDSEATSFTEVFQYKWPSEKPKTYGASGSRRSRSRHKGH